MGTTDSRSLSNSPASGSVERRSSADRRVKIDQRKNIRFDDSGGDRRSGTGRRSSDDGFEVLE